MRKTGNVARLCTLLGLYGIGTIAGAANMQLLSDAALADIQGRDGLSFAINLNANIGSAIFGATDSVGNPASASFNNLAATGVIAATFDVMPGTQGMPDYLNWAFPNIGSANNLQVAYDMVIAANGSSFGTSIMFQNLAFNGSSVQWSASSSGGATFGLSLDAAIGNLLLQPNGRGNSSGQMAVSGIQLGAAGNAGMYTPWVIANITTQPGIFNVVTDANGNSNLQLGIGWPTTPGNAASGSLQIGNITFGTPSGNVNLGAGSIGSMQIQYLNIKFKS